MDYERIYKKFNEEFDDSFYDDKPFKIFSIGEGEVKLTYRDNIDDVWVGYFYNGAERAGVYYKHSIQSHGEPISVGVIHDGLRKCWRQDRKCSDKDLDFTKNILEINLHEKEIADACKSVIKEL